MLTSIEFVSLAQLESRQPAADTVVVSILDRAQSPRRPPFKGYRDALQLTFLDFFEECLGATPGTWPAEPNERQHAMLTDIPGERVPALSDAEAAVQFLAQHHASAAPVKALVHCFAGTSRSAAVARWAARKFKLPLTDRAGVGTREANPRVLRLLQQANKRMVATAGRRQKQA